VIRGSIAILSPSSEEHRVAANTRSTSSSSRITQEEPMPRSDTHGTCKLTKQPGRFVDSHLIPEALTRPSAKGVPFYQYGEGRRPIRRWSSWYDPKLVTLEGEKYLSDLDAWAIDGLREHRLVWSGWGPKSSLNGSHIPIVGSLGIRQVSGLDPKRLRLFFLSLLWRAAATELEEFSEISMSDEELEHLRQLIVSGDPGDISFYPCQLTQLSTKGTIHNHAPVRDIKLFPGDGLLTPSSLPLPTFRFYFDGLIAHMHVSLPKWSGTASLGNLIVGVADTIVLSTVSFKDSLQNLNMQSVLRDYSLDTPMEAVNRDGQPLRST
jgi:hypothetical protein